MNKVRETVQKTILTALVCLLSITGVQDLYFILCGKSISFDTWKFE